MNRFKTAGRTGLFALVALAALSGTAFAAPSVNKGDVAWMLVATALVVLMSLPGLALFYGGLVRSKNVLSIFMQVMICFCMVALIWVFYGYSLVFTNGSAFIGDFSKSFLRGVDLNSVSATFSKETWLPEYVFVIFQLTFACITPALIVGAFAERMKFSAVLIFIAIWVTFAYLPMAHMVWWWAGPDALTLNPDNLAAIQAAVGNEAAASFLAQYAAAPDATAQAGVLAAYGAAANASNGYLFNLGALDFAGGTVVHINAGVAGLVCAIMLGKRVGFGRDPMPPHSLALTLIGTGLLWVGWFGFNAGSNLEANSLTGLAFLNTIVATAGATLAWTTLEWVTRGHPSLLGAASGAVAGLVAITPACGWVGPMAGIAIGVAAGIVCFFAVVSLKKAFGYDDALDVFGVHGVGGIVGALLTGIFVNPALGGMGVTDYVAADTSVKVAQYVFSTQMYAQIMGVLIAIGLSASVSVVALLICKYTVGLRVTEQSEREGLDITSHGERAYS